MLALATIVMILEQEENGLSVLVVDGYTKNVLRILCMTPMERKSYVRYV